MKRDWNRRAAPFTLDAHAAVSLHEDPAAPLVVYCHGMSEGPDSLERFWPRLCALPVHLIAPAGPYAHEVRKGNTLRIGHAWYLYDGSPGPFKESVERVIPWLRDLLAGLEREHGLKPRIRALVGYSQGAYFGYAAALRSQDLFGNLVAVAGRLKTGFVEPELQSGGALRTLILHGESDPATPVDFSARSEAALRDAGFAVERQVLPGGHGLRPDRDAAAAAWLRREWKLD